MPGGLITKEAQQKIFDAMVAMGKDKLYKQRKALAEKQREEALVAGGSKLTIDCLNTPPVDWNEWSGLMTSAAADQSYRTKQEAFSRSCPATPQPRRQGGVSQ